MLGLIILCLHDMDCMNLFSMLPQRGSVLKSLAAHGTADGDFKVLVDMCQHTIPVCMLKGAQFALIIFAPTRVI